MDLNTKQAITRPLRDVEVVPITPNVIKAVEQLAFDEGFKSLKLENRARTIICASDWLAGVDCTDDETPNKISNDDDDEDDEDHMPPLLERRPDYDSDSDSDDDDEAPM